MGALFRLPDEELLAPVLESFPGRGHQIRSLATLVHPCAAPCRNLVLHGTEATGKSTITKRLLANLADAYRSADLHGRGLQYAIVNAAQCITTRHLFETIVGSLADTLKLDGQAEPGKTSPSISTTALGRQRRCETMAQLSVIMSTMLQELARDPTWRFILVLDAIDRQRDAPPTLIPALARLSEIIPSLTTVFIVTAPPAGFLRTPASAILHFPPYTKSEFVRILSLSPPPAISGATQLETTDLWTRFCAAVHDAFVRSASRTLPSFRHSCRALWPRFTAPVTAGTYSPREFSKLLVAARVHFQDESLLDPGILSARPELPPAAATVTTRPTVVPSRPHANATTSASDLTALLPIAARLILLAAYLASHNATRHDLTLFSTHHHSRKRRRGGGLAASRGTPRSKHRRIARKLLGAHAFVLERMMAIFEVVRSEWSPDGTCAGNPGLDGDIGMALATLASLRLLVKVGAGDMMDRSGKWRINISWESIRGIGRSVGVEVEEWLIE
ncbi:origin recognition complex subunit Orc5 [Metarhizium album ARSEF 1941]|uniref:Origin recognition complex subunit Orc5 n=1 Tax=Metarhizium album (strain ARSEF 1941) TaxID=1081103 RepID=A0A0B2WP50_METAS|nr:origin recognition complex subunit Orc5 [Metarhizium album ARSEF 1941]KHN97816.1 origin recognition complex subunit Orc5 [Metarhizium album ARSEF 1941]